MSDVSKVISIVIPTLNSRQIFLEEALGSVAKQSLKPFEVIVVNNGRGSLSSMISDVPVRVVHTVYRAGGGQARNFGLSLAHTEYVAFLDDDDLWGTDYLESMERRIMASRPDCLVGRLDQLVGGVVVPFKNAHGLIDRNILMTTNPGITGSTTVVRRDSFLESGGFNARLTSAHDKALVLELLKLGKTVLTAPECQAILRQHQSGDRITDSAALAAGLVEFYREYKGQMNVWQKAKNLRKIVRYKTKAKLDVPTPA